MSNFEFSSNCILKRKVAGFEWVWDPWENMYMSRKVDAGGELVEKYLDDMAPFFK